MGLGKTPPTGTHKSLLQVQSKYNTHGVGKAWLWALKKLLCIELDYACLMLAQKQARPELRTIGDTQFGRSLSGTVPCGFGANPNALPSLRDCRSCTCRQYEYLLPLWALDPQVGPA